MATGGMWSWGIYTGGLIPETEERQQVRGVRGGKVPSPCGCQENDEARFVKLSNPSLHTCTVLHIHWNTDIHTETRPRAVVFHFLPIVSSGQLSISFYGIKLN